jgi:predicted DNA-binding WGR domain protein
MATTKETSAQTIERLTSELAAANQTIQSFQAQAAQADADEIVIREKMSHGLSREQAASVIKRQRAYDEAEKKG